MAKKESTFSNMLLTLLIVTAISSLAASGVYNLTKEPIARVQRLKQERAIQKVMPGFTRLERMAVLPEDGKDSLIIFKGFKDSEELGLAINTYTYEGYSGLIKLMVGFQPDGTITNIDVLEQKETPGLGTKMAEPFFIGYFVNKNPANFNLAVKKDGGDVDAITAATITSRAFCDAVQRAYDSRSKIENENN